MARTQKPGRVREHPAGSWRRWPLVAACSTAGEGTGARFDRAHFKSFGDFALIYEVVYYVLRPDYNTYMDVQQSMNFRLMEEFEKAGLEFAYPTQQLFVTRTEPV